MSEQDPIHEDASLISPATRERHRALVSLREELEAIDWYEQRIDATRDPELRKILAHNRAEEIEHAALLLAWLVATTTPSVRSWDFLLTLGQDLALGYASHSAESVELYLVESFVFQTFGPWAAVPLVYS